MFSKMFKLTVVIFLMAAFLIGHNVVSSNEDDEEQVETTQRNAACKKETPGNERSEMSLKCSEQDLGVCTDKSEEWEVVHVGCEPKDPEMRGEYRYYFYCVVTTNSSEEIKHGNRKCIIDGTSGNERCTVGQEFSTSGKYSTCETEDWGIKFN